MPSLFEMEITKLKGVGEKRAALYRKLGAPTVGDLLRLYPRAVSYTHLDVYKRQTMYRKPPSAWYPCPTMR